MQKDSKWKKIFTPIAKLANILLMLIPFLLCWFLYYEPRTLTVNSHQVSAILICLYACAYYYMARQLDGFRFQIVQVRDMAFGQMIAAGVTDCVTFLVIWMLSAHFPNLWPGLAAYAGQCLLSLLWAKVAHNLYFETHPPLKSVVVYDVRQGMENLISEYGLEKRYEVTDTYPVEEVVQNLHLLDANKEVFLCGIHSHERNIIIKYCIAHNIRTLVMPRVGDVIMSAAEPLHMLHLPIMDCRRCHPSNEYLFVKRLVDILVSGVALIVLSPIMLVTALAIKSDGGPAFYKQVRLTKDGRKFNILKFRSMRVDAEKYSGAVLSAGENDPRITKVGRVIRACRLDELPQLINILKGDMTIVGPRPERPEIAAEYEKELPEFALRLQVKAGLTGYAQVYGKYNTTPYDKLTMDLMYIAKLSVLEDLCIMLATLKILTSKESTEGVGAEKVDLKYEVRDKAAG